jgi:hypothetical protein
MDCFVNTYRNIPPAIDNIGEIPQASRKKQEKTRANLAGLA